MNAHLGTVGTMLHRKGSHVWSIAPDAMVFEAIKMMAEKNIGALLVMDGSGKLLGIVSERDYARKVILQGHSSRETPVRDIMTRELVTVSPKETVSDCMRLITEKRIRHLPVMVGDKLQGLLSIGDLVKWIMAAQEMTIDQLEKYIVGEYPA